MTEPFHSHARYINAYDTGEKASEYAQSQLGTRTHQRESRCISRLLAGVPRGADVLDLPCGASRFLPLLADLGYQVTESDASPAMLRQGMRAAEKLGMPIDPQRFVAADILHTPFSDGQFDAVLCNRMFHHFNESTTRRAALHELSRISRGPIVLSFFCAASWDGVSFHLRHLLHDKRTLDRVPIRLSTFRRDWEAEGLRMTDSAATRPGISKQRYLRLERVA